MATTEVERKRVGYYVDLCWTLQSTGIGSTASWTQSRSGRDDGNHSNRLCLGYHKIWK